MQDPMAVEFLQTVSWIRLAHALSAPSVGIIKLNVIESFLGDHLGRELEEL